MTEETITATPAVQAETPAEQVQQVEATEVASAEATTEQTQAQPETSEDKAKKEPWFQKRIGELTREKYEARRIAAEAEQRAQELERRLSQPQQEQTEARNALDPQVIRAEAQRLIAEQSFNEKCNQVYQQGKAEFQGEWDAALSNLRMVGVPKDFLELATASDAGAKLIHHLGKDLDEAARIVALPPVLMARELTRLEFELAKPKAKPVSSAPAPITPISGTSGGSKAPEEMTDKEFAKWRREQIAQRHSR